MASDRERIDALIAHLDEFLSGADRRRTDVPIEVGSDRRWSITDTERLFERLGRPVPVAPPEQRMSDVLADVVRLRNALTVLREGRAQAEAGSDAAQEGSQDRHGDRSGSDPGS
ncbi:MAG TPA: hypothetical protein VFX13_16095 [Gaiellales bacterium]|nr:hypothetical protein [Gaiellales bacterium]